jgi:hypothetical protein
VILKDTHPQVKFDVFERLNSGATKLTPQELRHGLYFGDLMSLATKSVKESNFLTALEIKNDKRMKAEELVLRFWALSENFSSYKKPLATFINDFSDANRNLTGQQKETLQKSFVHTLTLVREAFGELTFKVFNKKLEVTSSFNSALYDALMVGFHQLASKNILAKKTQAQSQHILGNLIETDAKFRRSIGVATSDETQVKYRTGAIVDAFKK